MVSLKDSLDGCERILRDELKDYPEAYPLYDRRDYRSEKAGAAAKIESSRRPVNLKVLMPYGIFLQKRDVLSIITRNFPGGELGILPHRLDCVAALTPGILTYETKKTESFTSRSMKAC